MDTREASAPKKVPPGLSFAGSPSPSIYLVISRWEDIPAMQTGRDCSAAVRVPGHGILAIGGGNGSCGGGNEDWLEDVELLRLSGDNEDFTSWRRMAPMLQLKRSPSACYFRGFVFVCSWNGEMDLERFDVAAGATGQWTRIACQFSSGIYRNLLSLKGSLWIIGDLNAPSTSQPNFHELRIQFSPSNSVKCIFPFKRTLIRLSNIQTEIHYFDLINKSNYICLI